VKVGVDATELRPGAIGGVPTAIRLLLAALRDHAPEIELSALAPADADVPEGVRLVRTGGPERPRRWRRSRRLRRALADLDLFHSPVTAVPDRAGPVLTATVHELPFVENARLDTPRRALTQWFWLSRAMGRCAALVAPSRATLRQMCAVHAAAPRLTHVVPHPAPVAPRRLQREHDGSLLFVGRLDRRKHVEALLAGAAAGGEGPILLVGPHEPRDRLRIEEAARRHGVYDRVRFLGVVDAATLDDLYFRALAVGLVSLSEGFGFPVLEALARGVPVVVTQGTGAAEVGGEVVLVVDPVSPDQVGAALERAAEPAYRERVARLGPARAAEFTPERTARGYREVFLRALGR
jgi:glycosyltransferase involved in cell wall biosynthesis